MGFTCQSRFDAHFQDLMPNFKFFTEKIQDLMNNFKDLIANCQLFD